MLRSLLDVFVLLLCTSCADLVVGASSRHNAEAGWHAVESMAYGRHSHTATLIASDETVLIVGGEHSAKQRKGILATVEAYDPRDNSIRPQENLAANSAGHRAVALESGLLLVGGWGLSAPNGVSEMQQRRFVQLYDPAHGDVRLAGSLSRARANHTATSIGHGRFLVLGGNSDDGRGVRDSDGLFGDGELCRFDETKSKEAELSVTCERFDLHQARVNHTATVVAQTGVVVAGGLGATHYEIVALMEPMQLAASIARGPAMAQARHGHTATAIPGGLLLCGGSDDEGNVQRGVEVLEDDGKTVTERSPMLHGRIFHCATLLNDGTVLVTGGQSADGSVHDSVEIYDPVRDIWVEAPRMSAPRRLHTATLLSDGTVLVVGGDDGRYSLGSAEFYAVGATAR